MKSRASTTARTGLVFGALLLCWLLPGLSAAAAPLLEPGKRDIYQRVLTRPGARVFADIGVQAGSGELVKTFSRLYVYAREERDGEKWLRVGADSRGSRILGWLPAERTVPWRRQLIVTFADRGSGRERVLFFEDAAALRAVLEDSDPGARAAALLRALTDGTAAGSVVAAEPERPVDFAQQPYLLPILEHSTVQAVSGDKVRLLQVASVTQTEVPTATATPPARPTPPVVPVVAPEARNDYRAAVVFVIDSTISMRPYIEATKAAVRGFYDRIEAAGMLDRVAFGLVAFRAQSGRTDRNKRLDYVAKTYVRAADARSGGEFLRHVAGLAEAEVPTDHFDEDAYAGIMEALSEGQWDGRFTERYIILITDAGALDGGRRSAEKSASITGLDAERLQAIARTSDTALVVLHLHTPQARRQGNTDPAADQYRVLSRNAQNLREAYFPLRDGAVEQFNAAVDATAEQVIENVQRFTADGLTIGAFSANPAPEAAQPSDASADAAQIADIRAMMDSLGYAMQLKYLGRIERAKAPEVFRAWISDKDLAEPSRDALAVQVLLSKNQLSDLQEILKRIIAAAEESLTDRDETRTFFDRLASLAAQYSVDPAAGDRRKAISLVDLGLLDEYLSDLPYKSDVLSLSQDTWVRWGIQRQTAFLDELHNKVRLYRYYNEDLLGWIDLSQSGITDPAELVYPVPLEQLP